jgi:hypothetical protein
MNVKTVRLNRKYNLGNYEQVEVGLEVDLTEIEGADAETVKKAMVAIDKLFPHPVIPELFMDLPKLGEPVVDQKPPTPKPKETPYAITKFPQHLQQHLTVKNGKIYSEYVSKEKWSEINEAAKQLGYEYVGGKGAHWIKK